MKNNTTTCHPESIELFLQQKMSDSEQADFEIHLDQCCDCRHKLETAAASDDIWASVRDSLQDETLSLEYPDVDDSAQDAVTENVASFSHRSVLNLLAPADDERMLGRLGTYEVVGVIGAGGMGIVLKALDPALNRYVAIKILAPHLGSSGAARKRFLREAQAAAAVVHDSVIEIHGVAETKGLPYLVMSYVRGPSLQRRLDETGPLALVEILRVGMQAANGLAAAHAQGLVHRDIKPANILLADGVERVKLTDFGLARAADDASLTRTGIIAGTPQYMSPEQARGETVDQASDLFSLGSVLYTMCTGRPPFRSETSYGVLRRITDEEPRPIREINPEVPEWLCQIISRLMAKEPAARFATASEVSALLEECLAHVQRPTEVSLPETLAVATKPRRAFRVGTLIAALSAVVLGMCLWQATEPPDIAGKWRSKEWGTVTLNAEERGQYAGTYQEPDNAVVGTVNLKWSRIEGRFNGTWREGEDRFGNLSVRLADEDIRGAWTTSRQSRVNPGTPELADLLWVRPPQANVATDRIFIKGQVISVADGRAVLSIGEKDGIKVGMKLIALDQGLVRGRIDITKVEENQSIGRIHETKPDTPVEVGNLVENPRPGTLSAVNSDMKSRPAPTSESVDEAVRQLHPEFFESTEESIKVPPKTAAEKAIARLVLVYFRDQSRRAIPGILVDGGSETFVVTAGPAGIVPEGAPHAIDRTFLEIPNRPTIDAVYQPQSTKELFVYRTQQKLTDYQPSEYVLLAVGDELAAIYPGSSPQLSLTPQAARIVSFDNQVELALPPLKNKHRYEGLIQLDRSLPEGTPLFKEGQLAGLTLLGTRFLGEKAKKSYMIPIERIAVFCRDLKIVPEGSRQLSDVVQEFNQQLQLDPVGKGQPLLTDDEVVASVRWALLEKKIPGLSTEQLQQFREIAEQQRLSGGWRLEFVTELDGVDQERFQAWQAQLVLDQPQGAPFIHVVRTRLLNQLDAAGQPVKLNEPGPKRPDDTPLAAAIHGFNATHRSLGGMDQPPLTEEEVVAVIRWMKTKRNELDVSNAEFSALQKIADQRQLPEDVDFEILKMFQPGDGFEYLVWSIRLTLPRIENNVPYPRYTINVRKQYVRSQAIDNGKIVWGPVADNGLQAGVRFEPQNEQYATGQQVLPRFYYRNTGDQFVEIMLPRLMTHNYYTELSAVDDTGKPIPIAQDKKPAGPVGWWLLPFGFGSQHEIRGLPIRLGDVERGQAETVIQAKPGQSVRVRFTLPNYADKNAPPLKTGEIQFSMAEPVQAVGAARDKQE